MYFRHKRIVSENESDYKTYVLGVDEVGRGSFSGMLLALKKQTHCCNIKTQTYTGPVTVCCVHVPLDFNLVGVKVLHLCYLFILLGQQENSKESKRVSSFEKKKTRRGIMFSQRSGIFHCGEFKHKN